MKDEHSDQYPERLAIYIDPPQVAVYSPSWLRASLLVLLIVIALIGRLFQQIAYKGRACFRRGFDDR